MTPLEQRVLETLGADERRSAWEKLIALFRHDREAFYSLANADPSLADPALADLANLAADVRTAVRETYEIVSSTNGTTLSVFDGKDIPIPVALVPEVKDFLREIDGKTTTTTAGKDYEGTEISEAERRFKLGDSLTLEFERKALETRRSARPVVFRVDPADIENLSFQPAYVTEALKLSARKTVLNPTCVFQGLKRGLGSSPDVDDGWAICGKPRQIVGNDGKLQSAPEDIVFVVFADKNGFVFDWDWVKENPGEPGVPIDDQMRFGNPKTMTSELVLELPSDIKPAHFDSSRACYSERGDCIFYYLSDDLAFADKINSDLTVFRQFGSETVTGFKVKNVRRICQEDKSINLDCVGGMNLNAADEPELKISVVTILMASLKGHQDTFDIYRVVIEALFRQPPRVSVPKQVRSSRPQLTPA